MFRVIAKSNFQTAAAGFLLCLAKAAKGAKARHEFWPCSVWSAGLQTGALVERPEHAG